MRSPPAGKVIAFLENEPRPVTAIHATVERIIAGEKSWTYLLRDESGVRRLSYRAPEPMPSIVAGHAYDLQIEYIGGYPAASGIVVKDERGLLFAAATDQQAFQHVLKNGIEGFDIAMSDAGCPSRSHERCYDAVFNQKVRFARGAGSASLTNGQSAAVGDFRVHVLTAQKVVYNKGCADAGLVGVSFTVTREK